MHAPRICIVLLWCATAAALAQGRAPDRTLLERLYSLVWPAGRFNGDLVRAVERNTQKGASDTVAPSLYLVNASSRTVDEWPMSSGAGEPVVCQMDRGLVFRLGTRIVAEPLTIANGRVSSGGARVTLAAPSARRVLACASRAATSIIWIQADDGGVTPFVRRGTELVRDTTDVGLGKVPSEQLADFLRVMGSLRPDGSSAAVLNRSLVRLGEGVDGPRSLIVDAPSLRFSGVPSWVPATDSLFVVAGKEGGR